MSLLWAKVLNGRDKPVGFIEVRKDEIHNQRFVKFEWVHSTHETYAVIKTEWLEVLRFSDWTDGFKVKWKQRQRLERAGILRKKPKHG